MHPRLRRHLQKVEDRLEHLRRDHAAMRMWLLFSGLALGLLGLIWGGALPVPAPWAAAMLTLAAVTAVIVSRRVAGRRARDLEGAVRLVERLDPELDAALLTAVELEPDLPDGQYGYLATRLVDRVVERAHQCRWTQVVPESRLSRAKSLHAVVALLYCVLAGLALFVSPHRSEAEPMAVALSQDHGPRADVVVLPGDTAVEKGRSVLISAEFGTGYVPGSVELVIEADGEAPERQPMAQSLDDPLFGVRIASATTSADYRIEWSGGRTADYRLDVFEFPEVEQTDVAIVYPTYAGQPDETIEDTRRVTAPEGSTLTVIARLNKPVVEARLVNSEAQVELELTAAADPREVRTSFVLSEPGRFTFELVDSEGRSNPRSPKLVFLMTENRRPDVRLHTTRDARVSPIEELRVQAGLTDDFGVTRHGLGYRTGMAEPVEIVIGTEGGRRLDSRYTLALEDLAVEPAELLAYWFWAEDLDVEGEVRRTTGDLYFAEVREFEEIFRQSEPEPGGGDAGAEGEPGAEGGDEAAELVELQRDVLLATWNVLRRAGEGTGSLLEEVGVVREAQAEARTLLDAMSGAAGAVVDEGSQELVREVGEHMDRALVELDRATEDDSLSPLHEAIGHEQAAYAALLELQASEFQVEQGSPSAGPPGGNRANAGGGAPSQAELSELELDPAKNRYETESQARANPGLDEESAQETRVALNRLKELARRQSDLNERIRELQSELQAAKDEEEAEELRRRLERLQEAQEEILRDTDELRQQMDESGQRERLTEEREQLERTRENLRRASEALEEGQLSRALAEGSRAERELDELEDELRSQAGRQFEQRMRTMQADAQRLEAEQERVAEELEALDRERQSLAPDGGRERITRQIEEQEAELEELLDEVEQTMRDAEATEPLLAEELFETLDEARANDVAESLESTRELLERGFPLQARSADEEARKGLSELREGIEGAARNVLGTNAEALERAQEELERLTEELEGEAERARGETSPDARSPESQAPQEGSATSPSGESPPSEGASPDEEPSAPGGTPTEVSGRQRGERPSLSDTATDSGRQPESAGGGGRGGGGVTPVAPLTGEDFLDWSDRLRDVEELIDDPELSAEAARIRSRARALREEARRGSREPNWDLVDEKVTAPLVELHRRVAEEARRRRADDALVPIDRDPVPPEFSEAVRRYYERLGQSR